MKRAELAERRAARVRRAESLRWHLEQLGGPVVVGIADRDLGWLSWVVVALVGAFAALTVYVAVSI